jgi:hypothetical protein
MTRTDFVLSLLFLAVAFGGLGAACLYALFA